MRLSRIFMAASWLLSSGCIGCTPAQSPDASPQGNGDLGFEDSSARDSGSNGPDAKIDAGSPLDSSLADAEAPEVGLPDSGVPVDPLLNMGQVLFVHGDHIFLEGPRWDKDSSKLVFSDIPDNTIFILTPPHQVDILRKPSNNANGLAYDKDGNLLAAEHGRRRISSRNRQGHLSTVVERYQNMRLNSPNDLVVHSNGTIYFTDPPWGIFDRPGARELNFNGVFRLEPSGDLHLVWSAPFQGLHNTPRPNGIGLSPAEDKLYFTDDLNDEIWIVDLDSSGASSNPRKFFDTCPTPDGMAIDQAGNIFVGTKKGVEVFAPDGQKWGLIAQPNVSNVAFGGDDAKTLYFTAGEALFSVPMANPGIY